VAARYGRAGKCIAARRSGIWLVLAAWVVIAAGLQNAPLSARAQQLPAAAQRAKVPPRVAAAERFLAARGWKRGGPQLHGTRRAFAAAQPMVSAGSATWQPLGPQAVQSQSYNLVTGRVSALALDPSDATGYTLYVGTTGGGVWKSQNAGASTGVSFTPLTDDLSALSSVQDASISIGALTVQPGGSGVILAGTGDPNDALDSYYGAGILRSTDGGTTWSLISGTPATASPVYSFIGEGFAGFAWSTVNPDLVVAAVSQSREGSLVNAVWYGASFKGLYYSQDAGATWTLATITDGANGAVQGPAYGSGSGGWDGNAATSVVWNPVRKLFIAAVRYHGYYQSSDGITFTRMASQPGAELLESAELCSSYTGSLGSTGCPIFRGALAVNPTTGDTFAWTVADFNGVYNDDLGIWQDVCSASAGSCASSTISFSQQWNTAALENAPPFDTSITDGDYTLALAAIPSGQETMLLAGADDLWKTMCPYNQGCVWRNTTNAETCMSAQVGPYQHALEWNAANLSNTLTNPPEILVGNDSGLWRSTDAIGETGAVCSSSDASHFQNLNAGLGSLAEVESISQAGSTPYTMMAGLGVNGIAGVAGSTAVTADWPEILSGEGGPVAIDPGNASNWYANNEAGVSIYLGTPPSGGTPGEFNAVLNYSTDPGSLTETTADVVRDGLSMAEEPPYAPAFFLVDPLDPTQLLIATCRVWRGPANGENWSAANAISPILDGITGDNDCSANALIHSMAAMALPVSSALPQGGEVVYAGMYGEANGGATLAGHVLSATYNKATELWTGWNDLTSGAVANDSHGLNAFNYDISSIFIDPHDPTGQTAYVTVQGVPTPQQNVQVVYRTTNGGLSWTDMASNLPAAPANSLVVDPQDANTVYVATDMGVYATRQIAACNVEIPGCWAPFGSGLPQAPAVALSAQPASSSAHELIAATYGRGIWMNPLLTASGTGTGPATGTLSATTLTFGSTGAGELSAPQYVTLTNSGGVNLTSIAISVSGAFQQSNNCGVSLAPNSSCAINVQFYPQVAGAQSGTLTVSDLLNTQTVALSGTAVAAPAMTVSPSSLSFAAQQVSKASLPQTLTVTNSGGSPLANVGFQISGLNAANFAWSASTCGSTLSNVSGENSCSVQIVFTPASAGGSEAEVVVSSTTSGVAAATVPLSGTGVAAGGVNVNPALLSFPVVSPGQSSLSQLETLTNNGSATASSLLFTLTPPFSQVASANSCGTSLAAGASCTVAVIFSPTLNGPYAGALTIASGAQTIASVPLNGTGGVPGSVLFQPGLLTFAQTGAGLASSAKTVTITNPDSVNSLNSFALTATTGFKLVNNTCSSTLAAGASCTVGVEFAPASAGVQSGSLTATSSALPSGSFISLTGRGFDFAMMPSGSSTQTITDGQTANYTLSIAPLGGSQGVFTFQCSGLPPNSACTFNPASIGIAANGSSNVTVEIATGLTIPSASLSRPVAWPVLPLACGLALLPFALRRRRRALLLAALLAALIGGISSCTESGGSLGLTTPPPPTSTGITPAASYSIPVTATSNGVQHQVLLTLIVD